MRNKRGIGEGEMSSTLRICLFFLGAVMDDADVEILPRPKDINI